MRIRSSALLLLLAVSLSPLGSDGLPYLLPAFEVQGKGWGWKASEVKTATEKRQREIPLENDVVRFPDTQ
jgi:hypothetical protein